MTRGSPLEHRLRTAWQRRGPLAGLLWPLTLVYRPLAAWQRRSMRRQAMRLPVPVVVVGNVVAGGAGKTPVTLALASHLRARGWRPGIVSRGWGRSADDCREVTPDADAREVGDEPLLLRRRADVPVFVARRRADAARALLAAHPDVNLLLCDDGLQHLALGRDVEVVVFDARGAGNGWLLPAGPLREPWPRTAAAQADAPAQLVLRTEPGQPLALPAGAPLYTGQRALAPEALRADGTRVPLSALRRQALHAVAGIARPEAFFAMLRAAGLTLTSTEAMPDHYDFNSWSRSPDGRQSLICTEKDAVKLWRLRPDALAVPLMQALPDEFFSALDAALAARGYHPSPPSF